MAFKMAERIGKLPPYLFAELDRLRDQVASRGLDIIDLGVGDPDQPTPRFILDALGRAAADPAPTLPSYAACPLSAGGSGLDAAAFRGGVDPARGDITLWAPRRAWPFPLRFLIPARCS